MVAIKAANADAFIARPDPAKPVVLVFGPDSGLVSERVNALIKASVDDVNDPFALARLGSAAYSAVRRPACRVGEGRWPQHRTGGRGAARDPRLGVPRGHRGRQSAP